MSLRHSPGIVPGASHSCHIPVWETAHPLRLLVPSLHLVLVLPRAALLNSTADQHNSGHIEFGLLNFYHSSACSSTEHHAPIYFSDSFNSFGLRPLFMSLMRKCFNSLDYLGLFEVLSSHDEQTRRQRSGSMYHPNSALSALALSKIMLMLTGKHLPAPNLTSRVSFSPVFSESTGSHCHSHLYNESYSATSRYRPSGQALLDDLRRNSQVQVNGRAARSSACSWRPIWGHKLTGSSITIPCSIREGSNLDFLFVCMARTSTSLCVAVKSSMWITFNLECLLLFGMPIAFNQS